MPANPNCPRCGGQGLMVKPDLTHEEYYYTVVLPRVSCYCTQGRCARCGGDTSKYVDAGVSGLCLDCDNKETE